jgi:predicted DNA-binding transcriptional regulator AlpA
MQSQTRRTRRVANIDGGALTEATDPRAADPAAAEYVGLSDSTLEKFRLTGEGPQFVRIGVRAVGYRIEDLDAWLAERVRRSTSEGATK